MIVSPDFIKAEIKVDIPKLINKYAFKTFSLVKEKSSDEDSYMFTYHKNFKIEIRQKRYVTIAGSIHQYVDKSNHTDLFYSKIVYGLQQLALEIGFSLKTAKI